MIKIIYKELPINQISYLTREEFSQTGLENDFYHSLKISMLKYGFKDPINIEYGGSDYGDIFKVIVGNNRMVIAKELGIDKIPSIIVNHKADTFNIEGEVLNTEDEIKKSKTRNKIERNISRTPMSDLRKRLLSNWRRG